MLVLSRRTDERIVINRDIIITVLDVRDGRVKLGFDAPDDVSIDRQEVHDAIKQKEKQTL